jgi:hypothetical protein
MREMNEKMAKQLVDNIESAVELCNTLAITTGDEGFKKLGLLMITLLVAKTKDGDLDDLGDAIALVLSAKIDRNNATEDLKRGINLN